eukprot:7946-Heterococcus_DN1.PRE.2
MPSACSFATGMRGRLSKLPGLKETLRAICESSRSSGSCLPSTAEQAKKITQLVRNPNVCCSAKTSKEAHESYQQACASAQVGRQRWEQWPPPAYHW